LIERRARDVERLLKYGGADPATSTSFSASTGQRQLHPIRSSSARLERSGAILAAGSERRRRKLHYPKVDLHRYALLEDYHLQRKQKKERLAQIEHSLKARFAEQERRWAASAGGLAFEQSPARDGDRFEPFSEAEWDQSQRDAWQHDRRFSALASTRSPRKPQVAVDLEFVPPRPRTTSSAPGEPRYTDQSLSFGRQTRFVWRRLARSSSPDKWQRSPRYEGIPLTVRREEEARDPVPRKFLWTKEHMLLGRVATWTASEAKKFWRGWATESTMAKEGVSKAGKKSALDGAKAQRDKYGGLTLEKAHIVVKSLSKKPAEALSSQEIELLQRAKQFLADQRGGGSADDVGFGGKPAWDDRFGQVTDSHGNDERMAARRALFLNYSSAPERFQDKMLGRMPRDEYRLTEEEAREKEDYLKKTGLAAAKKAERDAAKTQTKKKK